MLATVGQAQVPDEELVTKLAEVFEQTRKAASAIAVLRPALRLHKNTCRKHRRRAAEDARRLAHKANGAAGEQMLQAAQAVAAEAELALTELDYLKAARLFGEAASLVPNDGSPEKGALLERRADALQRQGGERGDTTALRQAIRVYGRVLELRTRDRVPLDWARTQMNLGAASGRWGSGRAARRGWRRPSPPIARRWRN